ETQDDTAAEHQAESDDDEAYLNTVGMEPRRVHTGSIIPLITDNEDVSLTSLALDDYQVNELAEYIRDHDDMQTLMLRNDNIDDTKMFKLAEAIKESPSTFRMLNLNCNNIGANGAKSVVEIFKDKPTIKMLLLHGNPLGCEGVRNIVNGLKDISSGTNDVTRDNENRNMGSARTIETVASDLVSDAMSNAIRSESPILMDRDEILSPRNKIAQIQLKLNRLDLGDTKIDDEAISDIQRLLEFDFLKITTLNLSGNRKVTHDGWSQLAETLKNHKTVHTLSLDYNRLGDKGADIIGGLLATNNKLRCVDLEGNNMSDEGGNAILQGVKKNSGTLLDITLTPGNKINENLIDEIREAVRDKSN
ncbi:unnamed protein product, partial [Owenia fusiformis]